MVEIQNDILRSVLEIFQGDGLEHVASKNPPWENEGRKVSAQCRLKSLFTSDGMTVRLDSKMGCGNGGALLRYADAFSVPLYQLHKRKLMSSRACNSSKRLNSSSFRGNKSKQLNANNNAELVESRDEVLDGILGDDPEFENDDLSFYRGLVLDVSYRPVNVVCWKRSICLEFMEKADVLEYYDQTVSSPSGPFYIPAVLRIPHLLQVVKRRRVKRNLSRKNILCRDNFMCQYCSSGDCLTIDHILPITRGGEWTWENLVTACVKCNSTKGNMTPEEANMKLLKVPKAPKDFDIVAIPLSTTTIKILSTRKGTPEEWQQYLSKPFP